MNGRHLFVLFFMLVPFKILEGQEPVISFSGQFEDLPFTDFAEVVMEQSGLSFYYRESWVTDLRISLSASEEPLLPALDSILQSAGLNYFLDEYKHVFLLDTGRLLPGLPVYITDSDSEEEEVGDTDSEELTTAEQKYIYGRRVLVPETIHVGSGGLLPQGKKALINGKISDSDSGEPLIGATLYIEELHKGTATSTEGLFNFIVPMGTYQVVCNCMGMEELSFTMVVHSDGDLKLSMNRTLIPLDEVVVRANRYHNVKGSQMGFERLNYTIFKQVPLVMGERDIINVVKMLPGVQSIGEGAAGFNVRGSAVDQNMIYINKVPVYNSSHLFGFFTSFSPEIVADFSLYKSNMPASFGGRLASFFDIRTKQGNMKKFAARGGISSISAYAAIEGPLVKDKSSVILSARSTYSDWILKQLKDPMLRNSEAGFNDFSGVLTHELDDKTRIQLFAYRSGDRIKLGKDNAFEYGNLGSSIDVRHRFNQRITGNLALIYSRYSFFTSDVEKPSAGYEHGYQINHYELKSDFNWLSLGRHKLSFGSSAIYYHLNRGVIEAFGSTSIRQPMDLGMENGVETAAYVGDELSLSDRLTAYVGLRLSGYLSLGPSEVRTYASGLPRLEENVKDTLSYGSGKITRTYYGIEPRVNLRYMLGNNSSFKLSYNRGTQYLFMLSNTVALAPADQWKLCDYHIKPQVLDQVSAGIYKDFPNNGWNTSLEVYRKWGHNIVEYRDGASFLENPNVESETLQGIQKAYGIETLVRKNTGPLNGWISYTYARSFIQVDAPLSGEQINNGSPYPSNYDRPHSFSLVANYKRGRRISLSTNLVYMTGRPATYPVSIYYEYDLPYIHYSERNSYRIPDYFRVDFSINIEGNLKKRKKFHSFWMLNIYNLTGRKNAYSVYFKNVDGSVEGYKLSIFAQPIYTISWNIKLGNYASE
jgi:CarboxypepD_reg-like domain/TonB-dependent Receptor Plug Domain